MTAGSDPQADSEAARFERRLQALLREVAATPEVDCGASAREAVARFGGATLYHYAPKTRRAAAAPLLIVYALVNRPYILDLQAGRSTIEQLLRQGLDVYLLDWGYPLPADATLTLQDYVCDYIGSAVNAVTSRHPASRPAIMGICQGGTLSLCYASLFADKLSALVTVVTPVDFHTEGNVLRNWCRYVDVQALVQRLGNIPGSMLKSVFLALKPGSLALRKYLDLVDARGDSEDADLLLNFLAMERWIGDSPDQAGTAFAQFIEWFYQRNGFISESVELAGRRVRLRELRVPVLNIYALRDHLVPPAASQALGKLLNNTPAYSELPVQGGHIGVFVNRRALQQVPAAIADWVSQPGVAA